MHNTMLPMSVLVFRFFFFGLPIVFLYIAQRDRQYRIKISWS